VGGTPPPHSVQVMPGTKLPCAADRVSPGRAFLYAWCPFRLFCSVLSVLFFLSELGHMLCLWCRTCRTLAPGCCCLFFVHLFFVGCVYVHAFVRHFLFGATSTLKQCCRWQHSFGYTPIQFRSFSSPYHSTTGHLFWCICCDQGKHVIEHSKEQLYAWHPTTCGM